MTPATRCFLVAAGDWATAGQKNRKHLERHTLLIGQDAGPVQATNEASVKFRDRHGRLHVDPSASLHVHNGQLFLRSELLANDIAQRDLSRSYLIILIEEVQLVARVWLFIDKDQLLDRLNAEHPELRLCTYGLPPTDSTVVDSAELIYELVQRVARLDSELVSAQTDEFLRAPPILVPLVSHVAALTAEENLKFPVQLKRLSDHFRQLLHESSCAIKIEKIDRNHLETWADAQGSKYAFLDGGVARVLGLPGGEPTALRVGVYCVRAGDFSLESREKWSLVPFVVGDIIDRLTGTPIPDDAMTNVRRLAEASRYTLESLTGLSYADTYAELRTLFMHGPLVNQFTMYDEGEPNYIPYLNADFLAKWNIRERDILGALPDVPKAADGVRMWRQFTAVYGFVARRIYEHRVPIVGVIERSAGRWLAEAALGAAVEARLVKESYKRKVLDLLRKYNISDDFLFGCVLDEGEFLTPSTILKNDPRKARERWQPVVGKFPHPKATVIKTSASSFPFRVEMNASAFASYHTVVRLIYHTARLLPRYAFPVGLDIVDRFAKVPDWLSRGVSARLGASVLERAVAQGDARLVTQLRQFLAHTPRDFFYRPT